ncbi:MAG: hypothetical protein R3335_14195 [Anaerolineales bacterium]|nr:hypothetical protein [Anaerolineales bacterium]
MESTRPTPVSPDRPSEDATYDLFILAISFLALIILFSVLTVS